MHERAIEISFTLKINGSLAASAWPTIDDKTTETNMTLATAIKKDDIYFHELHTPAVTMARDVHVGLIGDQKSLPPKYFYDKKGSELFDAITKLPEYYITRTEIELLKQHRH